MKKILTTFLLVFSIVTSVKAQWDTGFRSSSALGQLGELTGKSISSNYSGSYGGSSYAGIVASFLGPMLRTMVESIITPDEPANAATPPAGYVASGDRQIAPDIIIFCPQDIIANDKDGCKFYGRYPIPGEDGWFLEYHKTNETPQDHDFTVVYWEKEGAHGIAKLKYMRSGFPQNIRNDYLFGQTVNGHYDTGIYDGSSFEKKPSMRYKIVQIIYND